MGIELWVSSLKLYRYLLCVYLSYQLMAFSDYQPKFYRSGSTSWHLNFILLYHNYFITTIHKVGKGFELGCILLVNQTFYYWKFVSLEPLINYSSCISLYNLSCSSWTRSSDLRFIRPLCWNQMKKENSQTIFCTMNSSLLHVLFCELCVPLMSNGSRPL